mmetsp:Transcript_40466/g.79783  ORF Transcript_40466/g.79783 Transcript_40466/m.79783 type:complete len:100 (-) Transcript_40466:476-775(-)
MRVHFFAPSSPPSSLSHPPLPLFVSKRSLTDPTKRQKKQKHLVPFDPVEYPRLSQQNEKGKGKGATLECFAMGGGNKNAARAVGQTEREKKKKEGKQPP